jgi:GT2 family glycosyltransferase
MRIAILIASYNRKEKTIACIRKVKEQELSNDVQLEIFLTDDASGDGTPEEVKRLFPEVNLYAGTGSLFWAGGMRNSWRKALETGCDYFLLLNDDTVLFKNTIETLIQSNLDHFHQNSNHAISVGTTKDIQTGMISYGGRKLFSKYWSKSYLIESNCRNEECQLGNANIMLVPQNIVKTIGILSDRFTHAFADYDYTLRALKAGFKVIVAPGILGTCTNDHGKLWKSSNVKLSERIKYLYSATGLNCNEYLFYIGRHFPFQLPSAFFKLWLKTLFPFVYDRYKKPSYGNY